MPTSEYMRQWRESKGPCAIPGCEGLYLAKGYCKPHYNRLRKYGDPLGQPEPKPRRVVEKKPPRVRKYRICEEHSRYATGCRPCQAESRMYNRDYLSDPQNRERRNARKQGRDRSNERQRSPESRERATGKARAKRARAVPVSARQPLADADIDLIFSDLPALAVALMIGRSATSIDQYRHKRRRDPNYTPRGTPGRGPMWTPEEDAILLDIPNNKIAAYNLGRTYEAVKIRRSYLRRQAREKAAS